MSSTNPKSKFAVFPSSYSPSYDRSIDTSKITSNSSNPYYDESYSRSSCKPPRESFNVNSDHKNTKPAHADNFADSGQKYIEHKGKKDNSDSPSTNKRRESSNSVDRLLSMLSHSPGKSDVNLYGGAEFPREFTTKVARHVAQCLF